jgi:hypothetical protein
VVKSAALDPRVSSKGIHKVCLKLILADLTGSCFALVVQSSSFIATGSQRPLCHFATPDGAMAVDSSRAIPTAFAQIVSDDFPVLHVPLGALLIPTTNSKFADTAAKPDLHPD